MCHYPIAVWERQEHGSLHLHGHCHGRPVDFYGQFGIDVNDYLHKSINKKSLDVGVDANNYYPISLREVLEKLDYKHIPKLKEKEFQVNKEKQLKIENDEVDNKSSKKLTKFFDVSGVFASEILENTDKLNEAFQIII